MVDRATGVRCECTVDSHQMFSATWYKHLNDVPGLPIGPGDVVIDIGANQGFLPVTPHRRARVSTRLNRCRNCTNAWYAMWSATASRAKSSRCRRR